MKYLFAITALIILSCNPANEQDVPVADSIAELPAGDTIKEIKPVADDHLALTPEELKDDSIFTDGSKPTSWAVSGIDDPAAFKKFVKRLKFWVANDHKDSVSTVIAYPLRNPKIKDKQEFLNKYDLFFNEKVRKSLREQKLNQVFRNTNGAMIGSGELWINEKGKDFLIIAINYK